LRTLITVAGKQRLRHVRGALTRPFLALLVGLAAVVPLSAQDRATRNSGGDRDDDRPETANVRTTKTGPARVAPGGLITYTIKVRNTNRAAAHNVVVTDTLPGAVTFISATGNPTVTGQVITWPVIPILRGDDGLTFTVVVRAPLSGRFTNIVASTASTPDSNPADNDGSLPSARVTTEVGDGLPDVVATKTGPATVAPGGTIVYQIRVQNLGPVTATAVVVEDTLPLGVTFQSASGGGTLSGRVVTWPTIASLPPERSVSFTVTVVAPSSGTLTNVVASRAATPDGNPSNNNGSQPAARVVTVVITSPPPPPPSADIAVTKSGPASITGLTPFSYTITVRNLGPDAAANVIVTDTLPLGAIFQSASGGGTATGRVVTWPTIPTLANGASVSFTLTIVPPAAAQFTNIAAGTATTADPNLANNNGSQATSRVTTVVDGNADVVTTKTGPASVAPGATIVYLVTVRNQGPDPALAVVVEDTLPAAVFLGASNGGTLSGNVVTWPTIASLASGATQTYTVAVRAPASGTLTNVVASRAVSADPNPSNNNGSQPAARVVTVVTAPPPPPPPPSADIAVTKSGPASITGLAPFSYTITVRNLGPDAAANVVVTDTLPLGATFQSASGGGTATGRVVTWPTIATLANGASLTFTLTIVPPAVAQFTNIAAGTSTTTDPNLANNNGSQATSRVTTVVSGSADVVTTKTGPATVVPGGQVAYTITVRNAGPDAAVNVILTDTLPANVVFGSASAGGTLSGRIITWPTIPSLATGATLTYTVTVTAPTTGTFTNIAVSTSETADPDLGNNNGSTTGRVITTVTDQADLEAVKTAPAAVDPGGTVSYAITVTNHGPSPAVNVVIIDSLPAVVTFLSASDGGTLAGRVVTWPPIPVLAPGQSVTRSVTARAPLAGSFTNVVAATSATPDPDPTNNNGSKPEARPITTVRPIDVAIAKRHTGDFTAGTVASYTIEVTNVGPTSTVGPLVVIDTVPATLAVQSAEGPGWSCGVAGRVVTCSYAAVLTPGQRASFTIGVQVLATAVPRVKNRAIVSTPGDEEPTGNNVAEDEATVIALSPLVLEKRVRPAEVEVGDVVDYQLLVSNVASAPVPAVVVTDTLPLGFVFLTGTARLDGQRIPDPTGAPGPVLRIPVGTLGANATRVISYRLLVGAGGPAGPGENRAIARSESTGIESPVAVARVRFRGSLLSDRAFIVGKVALRQDSAGVRRDLGIPGVRVILTNGTTAITDEEGKYSFPALAPLLHVVRVDETTLPSGVRLAVTNARQAGTAASRFADLRNGELYRADFFVDSVDQSKVDLVRARRDGPVTAAIPDSAPAEVRGERSVSEPGVAGVGRDRAPDSTLARVFRPMTGSLATPIAERHGATKSDLGDRVPRPEAAGKRIVIGVPTTPVPADGATRIAIRVAVVDSAGSAGAGPVPVTLEATLGRWLVADRDSVEPGIQTEVPAAPGEATFGLVAPAEDGLGEIRVTAGRRAQSATIAFAPAPRPMIAAGFVQGRIDFRSLTRGALVAATPNDGFEQELRDLATASDDGLDRAAARGALYLRGKIKGKYLLTAAYDSERDPERRFFRDIQPEEFYPVYGDASIREYGAQSFEGLYVRLDHDRNSFLYGDYQTPEATESRELGAYLRTLSGAMHHFETDRARGNVFASRSENRLVVDELAGRGISGPYALSRSNGLLNTERVELVTRDRNQPARILRLEPMRRFADYSIEPFTGRLLFRRPVPSVDSDLNPVSIRVSYELERGGESQWTYGGDAQIKLGRAVEIGGSAVRQEDPIDNFELWSVNGSVRLGQNTTVLGEWARTSGNARDAGSAGRLELRHSSAGADFHLFAAESDSGFGNPSSTFGGGRRELGGQLGIPLDRRTRLVGQALSSEDLRTRGRRDGALVAVERNVGRDARLEVGYRYGRETRQPADTLALLAPNETHALHTRLAVDFGDSLPGGLRKGTLFSEYDQDVSHRDRRRGSIGAQYQVLPRVRAYGRHEFLSSFAGPFGLNSEQRTAASVFGLDAGYANDGEAFSEYRLRDGFSGREGEAVIGLRNRWPVARGVRLDASFERIHPTEGKMAGLAEATSVTGGIELLLPANTRATARLELRDAPTGDTWLATLGYAQRLSSDWTALGRFLWNDLGPSQVRTRTQFGLAWRQTTRSTWNGLARFERRFERADFGGGLTRRSASLLSAHANWQATEKLVVNARVASKWAGDNAAVGNSSSRARLAMIRAVHDLGLSWDVGVQGGIIAVGGAGGHRYGLGAEVGRRIIDDLRLAVGYNVFGFRDRDLRETEYTMKGLYLRFDYKFDEATFSR